MCGIFGILRHNSERLLDSRRVAMSAGLLRHRGPDHEGVYADEGIGLAHTRLSLLDLHSRSNQPCWDSQRRYGLVYNGEIYNYRELRKELEEHGRQFKTTSDTEVLLECLVHHGIEATLPRLEGMFAFALYDRHEGLLTLARDRFGIKPLYVYDQQESFMFASEIEAMRPWLEFEPDLLSISSYLQGPADHRQQGPANGFPFFKHIKIVAPGSVITVQRGRQARYSRFFSLGEFWDEGEVERLARLKPSQVADEVEEMLLKSIKTQLLADAPVGAFCSGGIDSSIIVAMASRFHNNLAIFHADVIGATSEHDAAAALAKHLRLDLKTVQVVDQDSIEMMPEVMAHYGYPFTLHPESVPFLMVSRLAQSHGIKAVLTGEGADECYIGYASTIFDLRKFIRGLPVRSYHAFPKLIKLLWGGNFRGLPGALRSLAPDAPRPFKPAALAPVASLQYRFERELEHEEICGHIQRCTHKQADDKQVKSPDLMSYLLRTLLHRNDCLGMAASIEARFPFLDSRLVKLAINMPYRCKVRFSPTVLEREHFFLRDKWVLRKVAERYLPAALPQRKKRGFPINAHARMEIASKFFEGSFVADLFDLDRKAARYLLDHAGRELKKRLLHLEVWAHVCLHGAPRNKILAKLRNHVRLRPPCQPATEQAS
ncbi:MAG: asparagine synthase (glutamine-hydrolyzing) [Candidatus Binatia bacterium]